MNPSAIAGTTIGAPLASNRAKTFLPFEMANAIYNGMKQLLTVDKAGRIVLPKPLREQFGLHPGSQLAVSVQSGRLELAPADAGPGMVREDGLWVHEGRAIAPLGDAVRRMRDERLTRMGG